MWKGFLAGVLLAMAVVLSGCETVKGIGRDITGVGSAVQGVISREEEKK